MANDYAKRPVWQWIIIYLVGAVVVYGLVYYVFFARKGGYTGNANPTPTVNKPAAATITVKNDPTKGQILIGSAGTPLYVFDKDKADASSCTGQCSSLWPPFLKSGSTPSLPAGYSTLTRPDGTIQITYKGKPLYYYSQDKDSGDTYGDGIGGIWHLAKP